jgi:riboflavin synthase
VTEIKEDQYSVTAIRETLQKTNLGSWKTGDRVNLERCMPAHGRFDGHIVQGHADVQGVCSRILEDDGSWRIWFQHPVQPGFLTVPKGSVCVNGVSLTVVDSSKDGFSVAIIPFTWTHTQFQYLKEGDLVNLEFDILGKYIQVLMERK